MKNSKSKIPVHVVLLVFLIFLGACARHDSTQNTAPEGTLGFGAVGTGLATVIPQDSVPLEITPKPLLWPQNLQCSLDSMLKDSLLATTQLGLCVYDLTADSLLFAYNPKHRMRPASTQKIITAVTALDLLGDKYKVCTRLCITGELKSSTLYGDVYVIGGFDPCFNQEDMKVLVRELRKAGIKSVDGNCYADVSMKDSLKWGSGWCWDDKNPTLTPLIYKRRDAFLSALRAEMKRQGVSCFKRFRKGICPPEARCLYTHSRSIQEVLHDMMKESDNLYAEALFYAVAAHEGEHFAGRKQAVQHIHNLISKMGYIPTNYHVADGSGLSLYNYVSAELEVAFLRYAHKSSHIFPSFYASMPISGIDGTLKNRMQTSAAYQKVRAKTGTVKGVSSLAGYATASNGHLLAFCIINQGVAPLSLGRNYQDKLCELFCR